MASDSCSSGVYNSLILGVYFGGVNCSLGGQVNGPPLTPITSS